jgi:hypothetical protein
VTAESNQADTSKEDRNSTRPIWIAFGLLAVFTGLYYMVVVGFVHSGGVWKKTYYSVGASSQDRVDITAYVDGINPVAGTVNMHMTYSPQGKYLGAAGTMTESAVIETNSIGSGAKQTTDAGDRIFGHDSTLDLEGDTAYYPLDKHDAEFALMIGSAQKAIPARLTMVSSLHDWSVRFASRSGLPEGEFDVAVGIKRSPPVITLAFGIMAVEVMIVLIQVGVVVRAIRLRKVQFTTLAALAALLFAIPAIRGSLPQTPPVGSLSDFLVFFWALIVAGVSFVVAAYAWFKQAPNTTEI